MIVGSTPVALLVEDDADACDIYSAFLSSVGFDVVIEHSANHAFESAVHHRPDVIIADVRLPGGTDGIALTTRLRLDVRTTSIPIIIVTGDALLEGRARAFAAGCDVFLTKPCTPDVLADHARALSQVAPDSSPATVQQRGHGDAATPFR